MITAHQNQIEQLRESFKNRIAEADKWPQKVGMCGIEFNLCKSHVLIESLIYHLIYLA